MTDDEVDGGGGKVARSAAAWSARRAALARARPATGRGMEQRAARHAVTNEAPKTPLATLRVLRRAAGRAYRLGRRRSRAVAGGRRVGVKADGSTTTGPSKRRPSSKRSAAEGGAESSRSRRRRGRGHRRHCKRATREGQALSCSVGR